MTTESRVAGLHHVTAVAGDPGANLAIYRDALGLRFVKRTVNFDDPGTYHLYYGDAVGTPGTVMTFFPFAGARPGRVGRGQVGRTAFAVPPDAVGYWRDRLADRGVAVDGPRERFGEPTLTFADHDGQPLALVGDGRLDGGNDGGGAAATDADRDGGPADRVEPWADGPVPADRAIRGFHGVALRSADPAATAEVLEVLGYEPSATEGDRRRFRAAGGRANVLDLVDGGDRGVPGVGTVHHVAFRTADDATQAEWRERLGAAGLSVTPVRDRRYFRSIYFREPGGVLFEIATDGPGFTRDEDREALGSTLRLPPWLEDDRERIEARLPPLSTPATAEAGTD